MLGINATAPKGDPIAEASLQVSSVHALCGTLDGVEDVKSRVDKNVNKQYDRPARMDKRLPACMLVDPVVDAFVKRHVQFAICPLRDKQATLGAEIGAGDSDRCDAIADGLI